MDTLAKGQLATVKTLGGVRIVRVWDDHGWAVEVCSAKQFEALERGAPAPSPIGFRRAVVELVDAEGRQLEEAAS